MAIIEPQFEITNYIDSSLKFKSHLIVEEEFTDNIINLGSITTANGQNYHVLTSFRLIETATGKRGNTTIYFLNEKKQIVQRYHLDMRNELPFKIKDNKLYFNYIDSLTKNRKVFTEKIEFEWPELICVSPYSCYQHD
ncbi:MAG: hypothetical protein V4613_05420 [Bacteroidota bacterium]